MGKDFSDSVIFAHVTTMDQTHFLFIDQISSILYHNTNCSMFMSMSHRRTESPISNLLISCPLSLGYFLKLLLLRDGQGIACRLILIWILVQPYSACTWTAGFTTPVFRRNLAHCQMIPVGKFQLHGITHDHSWKEGGNLEKSCPLYGCGHTRRVMNKNRSSFVNGSTAKKVERFSFLFIRNRSSFWAQESAQKVELFSKSPFNFNHSCLVERVDQKKDG